MKKWFLLLVLIFASLVTVQAEEWTTDYAAALAQAKAQKKLVLLNFTGSDWCGGCKLLDAEVLNRVSFKWFVANNYVPVTLDFPERTKQSPELEQQNEELRSRYKVDGFPTLVVVNPDGKEVTRVTGYEPGKGPKSVMDRLRAPAKK